MTEPSLDRSSLFYFRRERYKKRLAMCAKATAAALLLAALEVSTSTGEEATGCGEGGCGGAGASVAVDGAALRVVPGVPAAVEFRTASETVRVEALGTSGVRVRATTAGAIRGRVLAATLDPPPAPSPGAAAAVLDRNASCGAGAPLRVGVVVNGGVAATVGPVFEKLPNGECVALPAGTSGTIGVVFTAAADGRELLREHYPLHGERARHFEPLLAGDAGATGLFAASVSLRGANATERLYGLGQHQHGRLDQRGLVMDLQQFNSEVSVPLLVSSNGYAVLWNSPASGRVELRADGVQRWTSESTAQVDYVVFAPAANASRPLADLLARYVEATGRSPELPAYASGYMQCKLRYATQDELLNVTREFRRRDLPLSVVVIDIDHWRRWGDWSFDATAWPNVTEMVEEINGVGVEVMVSVWPNVERASSSFPEMHAERLLVMSAYGDCVVGYGDFDVLRGSASCMLDPFSGRAREYFWDRLDEGYRTHGIRTFWLDSVEGASLGEASVLGGALWRGIAEYDCSEESTGGCSQQQVGALYPLYVAKAVADGQRAAGDPMFQLSRSAFAGSQRYGSALWSGDIASSWTALRAQVRAGLNAMLSGVAWWTSDAGGFFGGHNEDPAFRELLVRWMEFSTFSPLMRLHGVRSCDDTAGFSNCPNEPWSYGEEVYAQLSRLIRLRERMRPYIHSQARLTSSDGVPLMRPLFFDFPDDDTAYELYEPGMFADELMFGGELLFAPVLSPGVRSRDVYLPGDGSSWWARCSSDDDDATVLRGGAWLHDVSVPLGRPALFARLSGMNASVSPLLDGVCKTVA